MQLPDQRRAQDKHGLELPVIASVQIVALGAQFALLGLDLGPAGKSLSLPSQTSTTNAAIAQSARPTHPSEFETDAPVNIYRDDEWERATAAQRPLSQFKWNGNYKSVLPPLPSFPPNFLRSPILIFRSIRINIKPPTAPSP